MSSELEICGDCARMQQIADANHLHGFVQCAACFDRERAAAARQIQPNACAICDGLAQQARDHGLSGLVMCAVCTLAFQERLGHMDDLQRKFADQIIRNAELETDPVCSVCHLKSIAGIDDDLARSELHDAARQPCHCSGVRCTAHLAKDELSRKRPNMVAMIAMRHRHEDVVRLCEEEVREGRIPLMTFTRHLNDDQLLSAHKMRIDVSDEVFVCNFQMLNSKVDTDSIVNSAIEFAEMCGKPIRWLVEPQELCKICHLPLPQGEGAVSIVWDSGMAHEKCAALEMDKIKDVQP